MTSKAEIYLLRHGETQWNVERRYQGSKNSPLTANGQAQAEKVGRILQKHLGAVSTLPLYVSPLGRTLETAALIEKHVSFTQKIIEPRLTENSSGEWEGVKVEDVMRQHPEIQRAGKRPFIQAPGGESWDAIVARISSWMAELKGPCVAVSHAGTGRIMRCLYLGLPQDEAVLLPTQQDVVWHLKDGRVELLAED